MGYFFIMKKTYSTGEAKELIRYHRALLTDIDKIIHYPEKVMVEIVNHARKMVLCGTFRSVLDDELSGRSIGERITDPDMMELVEAIDHYREIVPTVSEAIATKNSMNAKIQADIRVLSSGQNGLQWLFMSGKSRNEALEAFDELAELMIGAYGNSCKYLSEHLNDLKAARGAYAEQHFLADREGFLEILKIASPDIFADGNESREVRRVTGAAGDILKRTASADQSAEDKRTAVRAAAERLIVRETVKLLEGIPVDTLNRNKNGFRIKAMKDAGFNTIADVYRATTYSVQKINGIGDETAVVIKNMVSEQALEAQKTVHIRLNADDRDNFTEGLISALYSYRRKKEDIDALAALNSQYRTNVMTSYEDLKCVANGVAWAFRDKAEKEGTIARFRYLDAFIKSPVAQQFDELIMRINTTTNEPTAEAWADFMEDPIRYNTLLEEIIPGILGDGDDLYGLPEELALEIRDECLFPNGLKCTLRRYQEWGVKYILHQGRVLLGDEMGLGKTVQAIAAMVSLKNTGAVHFMVVCPASVLTNWCREIEKHSALRVVKVHGNDRQAALQDWLRFGGVAVTTFETTGALQLADDFRYSMAVVDEAHYIKNPQAQRTANVKRICENAERLLFMTGTALENRVDEMINLIGILQPELTREISKIAFMSTAEQFRDKVAPVYYRRKREDVLTELPELIDSKEYCTLLPEEERLYEEAILNKRYSDARRLSWNMDDLSKSSKAIRLREIVEEAEADGRKVLVFSFFLDTIRKVTELAGEKGIGPITGSVPPEQRQAIVDEFNAAPAGSVLTAQIQSGGTGLNIQAASVVILCEPQFKPSTENQAISRAYRMGQARNVLVYRLLGDDTIDEKIMDLLEEKQAVFDAFADKSTAAEESLELDDKTFGDIIEEEIDRINEKRGVKKVEAENAEAQETAETVESEETQEIEESTQEE